MTQVDNSEATSLEGSSSLSLSDSTRLGPYSILLKDAFEESQATQGLTLNESAPDLVAIARSLTPEEKAQGLDQTLVTREKIALIVDANNPFQGTLTLTQVAGIFRGEITNWSQVGGDDRPLTLLPRGVNHSSRLALETYGLRTDSAQSEGVPETTAAMVEQLGMGGISYAPASETIEQFNTKVLSIDNVGVDDGRYPFSQPLYYVFRAQPQPEVQAFLEFLASPDAQAAIDFAQSQPADPTRSLRQPDLSALMTSQPTLSASSPASQPTQESADPSASTAPAAAERPSETETSLEPGSPPPGPEAGSPGGVGSWVPLALIFLGLGLLSWLAYVRVKLEKKRQNVPRPAPDYAARLNAQGSNRQRDELQAIAEGPAKAKAAAATPRLETPDLSLDGVDPQHEDVNPDLTRLEFPSSDRSDPEDLEEDLTILQSAPSDTDISEADPAHEIEDVLDEPLTTLQLGTPPADRSDAPMETPESLDFDITESEDATVLQGVFESAPPAEPSPDVSEVSSDAASSDADDDADEPHRDPLTGQLTDELEMLSELEAAAEAKAKQQALKDAPQSSEASASEPKPAEPRWDTEPASSETEYAEPRWDEKPQWEDITDPWD